MVLRRSDSGLWYCSMPAFTKMEVFLPVSGPGFEPVSTAVNGAQVKFYWNFHIDLTHRKWKASLYLHYFKNWPNGCKSFVPAFALLGFIFIIIYIQHKSFMLRSVQVRHTHKFSELCFLMQHEVASVLKMNGVGLSILDWCFKHSVCWWKMKSSFFSLEIKLFACFSLSDVC
jgi:hypothetical protein